MSEESLLPVLELSNLELFKQAWPLLEAGLESVNASPLKVDVGKPIQLSMSPDFVVDLEDVPEQLRILFLQMGKEYKYQKDLTDEKNFALLDLASQGGKFLASFRVHDYQRTGNESYTAVDLVLYLDGAGHVQVKPIVKKAIIAGGGMVPGALNQTTRDRADKLLQLKELGVPTIHLHGVDDKTAILYESLYADKKEAVYAEIKTSPEAAEKYLPQLVHIGRILDRNKFDSLNFLSDLICSEGKFLYLDAGADVGQKGQDSHGSGQSKAILLRDFKGHADLINRLYENEAISLDFRAEVKKGVDTTLAA